MTHEEKNIQEEKDLVEEMEQEIEEIENEEGQIDEDKLEEAQTGGNSQVDKLQDALARTQADFVNYKNRVERDKEEMVFFLKSDILKKILPRIDDLQRIIKNTPEEMQSGALYE
jgi:molecular chaperone GrpE